MTSRVTVDDSTVPSNAMRRILPHPLTKPLRSLEVYGIQKRQEKSREGSASGTIRGREYNAFDQAHDWYNTTLFASMLPCLTMPVCFACLSPHLHGTPCFSLSSMRLPLQMSFTGGFAPCLRRQR